MDIEALQELIRVSDSLATLLEKPTASPQPVPEFPSVHPDLAKVLGAGTLALHTQGVDPSRIDEFTQSAKGKGMRRNVLIFGWHPQGKYWLATPANYGEEASVIRLNRLDKLTPTNFTIDEFVQECIGQVQERVDSMDKPKSEGVSADGEQTGEEVEVKPKWQVSVKLAESAGGVVTADDRTETLTGTELGYVLWRLNKLMLISEDSPPDMSRWERRTLRSTGFESVPKKKDPNHEAYQLAWDRYTLTERTARGSSSNQIPGYKFSVPGVWHFHPKELVILSRSDKSIPKHHTPSDEQAAIWVRWSALVQAESVQVRVK